MTLGDRLRQLRRPAPVLDPDESIPLKQRLEALVAQDRRLVVGERAEPFADLPVGSMKESEAHELILFYFCSPNNLETITENKVIHRLERSVLAVAPRATASRKAAQELGPLLSRRRHRPRRRHRRRGS